MSTVNLLLLLIEAGVYFTTMVWFLHLRHRIGLGVFMTALGVMHFLETYLAAVFYIELPFGIISPGSSVLFSGKLLMILLLYVKEDAAVVRAPIYGLLAGNFLTVALGWILQYHDTVSVVPGRVADLAFIDEMGWLMLWGTILLYLDSIAIILVYERLGRVLRRQTTLRFLIASAALLSFDQAGFYLALRYINGAPAEVFWGGWLAKMLAAVVFSVLIGLYLRFSKVVPAPLPSRPLGDIFNDLTYRERYEDLLDRSGRDALTGTSDRSRLEVEGPRLLQETARRDQSLSLLIVDADHFKSVNDQFGHLTGDAVLKDIARCLRENLRSGDYLYRFGGEEFVMLCAGLDHAVACTRAEAIRAAVAERIRTPAGSAVTVSIGVATSDSATPTFKKLLELADNRLYVAKSEGRNRIIG